jgi:acyl-coenzyme A synthetase/AMP-(fatty) acid ligase
MLIQADLSAADTGALRECVAAGEPLNPEVIEQVRKAWHITVRDGLAFVRDRVPGYKRIRRLEFADLPKTISGKIRRVELRAQETDARAARGTTEFWEEDFG